LPDTVTSPNGPKFWALREVWLNRLSLGWIDLLRYRIAPLVLLWQMPVFVSL
jgi:hypothetical protein